MKAKGCMFDFSGTVFRIEPCADWLRGALEAAGVEAPDDEIAYWAERLERFGAQPGGATPAGWRPEAEAAWEQRDLTAELHRHAYRVQSRASGLPWDIHDVLYDRHMSPAAWRPYPDAAEVLAELRARGVPVAVVSNIGWDLRPVFAAHGLAELVDAFVLSYEFGRQKPDPAIFLAACEALGVAPQDTLMVGDDREADGGAAALGCPVHFVDHLPAAGRPDALRGVLDLLA
ncbi:HAD-IA family hydrolase [Streptomyces cocklensis]|jgi:putative hydrolase of the HAD superfamily|uniref:Hydrolase of the HAD superfamily n=1 Tax=Actinacidiphila cocklensis TaxID=887465 RepID=A0A9W4GPL5_9ACTN|nr:HAD-IA family hydrolase [Actinacidiphila cocklensis]MDD1059298.1 HAD-IA family hydrolase [Actinacidiphila cocklensis]CAG6392503.1 Putative hydrolase of the HAD superfamily [Actinacidiphila cocklensis]